MKRITVETSPMLATSAAGQNTDKVYKVGVYGATGYSGQVLMDLLSRHPHVQIVFGTSESSREQMYGLELVPLEQAPMSHAEVVFLALPHGVAGQLAAQAVADGIRVIDLSADLRLDTPALYKQWYRHEHPAPHLLPAPYGLPEINRAPLVNASYIANPGCHVTSVLLALYPLAKAHALAAAPIVADTKTGISGAGKALKLDSMFCEVYGDVRPYNGGRVHRHLPEIEQELHKLQPDCGPLVFMPHIVPTDVGLLASVYAPVKAGWDMPRIRAAFEAAYADEPLVEVLPAGQLAQFKQVVRRNNAVIGLTEATNGMVIITCAIDNLRKGAASQAVQNFNVMLGLPETTGLL